MSIYAQSDGQSYLRRQVEKSPASRENTVRTFKVEPECARRRFAFETEVGVQDSDM
jgi:hypothetical protein